MAPRDVGFFSRAYPARVDAGFLSMTALVSALLLVSTASSSGQLPPNAVPGTILTFAGGGTEEGKLATTVLLRHPSDLAIAPDGTLYVADAMSRRVLRISPTGVLTIAAGGCEGSDVGDGGPANMAVLKCPQGIAIAPDGSLYIADKLDHRIRKVGTDGRISTVAGTGSPGYSGDGGPAVLAKLAWPEGIAVGPDGSVYIADTGNHRIRRVLPNGTITTFAGTGSPGYSGDGGPADKAQLFWPTGVSACPGGIVCIADKGNHRIRSIRPDGIIRLVAGCGKPGYCGDGGPATDACLNGPDRVFLRPDGFVFISDTGNHRIARISPDGTIETFCGTGKPGFSGDGGPRALAALQWPQGIVPGLHGELYIADSGNHRVRRVDADGIITTAVGIDPLSVGQEGSSAVYVKLKRPVAVSACLCGTIYFVDQDDHRARAVSCCGAVVTICGTAKPASYPVPAVPVSASEAPLLYPSDITGSPEGYAYVANSGFHQVVRILPNDTAVTFAGTGSPGLGPDGIPALQSALRDPEGVSLAKDGTLYIADTGNHRIRRVTKDGIIHTVAGTGQPGYSGDGGPAIQAMLRNPSAVTAVGDGSLYIADTNNHAIRLVRPDGTIETVAGTGTPGFSGDGGPAVQAQLREPRSVAVAVDGSIFIADSGNHRIRKIGADGIITTVAGTGEKGLFGDGGPAVLAALDTPTDVSIGRDGTLYIADSGNAVIRAVVGAAPPVIVATGDLNGDCRVDIADAVIALRIATGVLEPTPAQVAIADVAPWPGTEGRARGDGRGRVADGLRGRRK
ncbi:MAG: NHL domain-containing protein, partial [Armatimonadota bacterium]